MKSTVVDESLSSYKPMYCSREYQTSTRLNQQYEKSTLNKRQANVSKEELKALKELKPDNNRLILTADKGVALVVIDKQEYIKKAEDLLQESSYKKITDDPTAKQKKQAHQYIEEHQSKWRFER